MGFLSPTFLLAGLAIAIPLLIHLLHRQRIREIVFPALIYLKRTEREHARRVRIRQLLVLLLRIAAILLLALAGARPFLRGAGSAHPPTALAVVLDNSASSGVVLGDERALDRLKRRAAEAVRRANDQDRIWVLRAGQPWEVVVPVGREEALVRIADTEVSDAASDLTAVVERARTLVAATDLAGREVHVLSDLQRSALRPADVQDTTGVEVLVLDPDWDAPPNGAVVGAVVGGGLAPVLGQPTDVRGRVTEHPAGQDTVDVRLWMEGEVRGAARTAGEAEVAFPVPLVNGRSVNGFVERDPDALAADDRHYFVALAAEAPAVRLQGEPGGFLRDALEVLAGSGRVRASSGVADLVISGEGFGLGRGLDAGAVLILPPTDPLNLPGFNQRLRTAGIPWQMERPEPSTGERRIRSARVPVDVEEVAVQRAYRLVPAQPEDTSGVLVRLEDEAPWMVEGAAQGTRFLVLASPLDLSWTSLPVSSVMIQLTEWWVARWSRGVGGTDQVLAGGSIPVPDSVSTISDPEGNLVPLEGNAGEVRVERAGMYSLFGPASDDSDGLLGQVAVNVDPRESDLRRGETTDVAQALGAEPEWVEARSWERAAFVQRQGPELWRPLIVALLLVLVAESLAAAGGRADPEPVVVRV